ncbi:hypothetical protein A3C18_01435 [Candidatus Kaiserbacteria bacterium RIFCSPHIGHO2_02_FULL_54_11b]|uniref:HD domain-containing protein n=2 Tax=Candidatus Kaiseribacteriota TaxID=1752734 RepID=A0A1F6DRY7_9BACT|nr:MAG: hypothetical protein A3C18_01435 [Candidatus Kaiserbacteria bacterium RIFCSPHIGHO2_02_FULL_54_11b]
MIDMKTPREIYAAYTIMPSLQMHQLRVAAVGKLICEHFNKPVNKKDVVLACLFHDMGNILKFELSLFPEFTEPEGVEYWESIKADYREKYGEDEHTATQTIMSEVGLPEDVINLMEGVGFSKVDHVSAGDSFEQKVVQYSDLRVGPHHILSLNERIDEGRKRYLGSGRSVGAPDSSRFEVLVKAAREIEKQIFANTSIKPEDINDAAVAPLIEELRDYPA